MKPIIPNPIAVATAIFWNSENPEKERTLPPYLIESVKTLHVLTFSVRFGASFDQSDGILGKLACGLHKLQNLIHNVLWSNGITVTCVSISNVLELVSCVCELIFLKSAASATILLRELFHVNRETPTTKKL